MDIDKISNTRVHHFITDTVGRSLFGILLYPSAQKHSRPDRCSSRLCDNKFQLICVDSRRFLDTRDGETEFTIKKHHGEGNLETDIDRYCGSGITSSNSISRYCRRTRNDKLSVFLEFRIRYWARWYSLPKGYWRTRKRYHLWKKNSTGCKFVCLYFTPLRVKFLVRFLISFIHTVNFLTVKFPRIEK